MSNFIYLFLIFLSIGALAAPANQKLNEFFKEKTKIENPFELRDPFRAPPSKMDLQRGNYTQETRGSYSNLKAPNTHSLNLQDLRVVGVLIGKSRRALITTSGSSEIVVLQEGMKLGKDQAELKAILPGGIILVEKFVNVYGQEEYLETVIPISR
jgi:hypothetical protein